MKDRLRKEQPIVYQTLSNCLNNEKLSHALLFSGAKGTPKLQTAILLAQSLICENKETFACEQCDQCRRIQEGQYADVMILDGSEKSIKKDDILNLQHEFNKTALEESGRKVYILNRAENATPEALNSLLKFLEEPNGESTTAILVVEEMDRLLATIVSRCQILPFRPISQKECQQSARELRVSHEDSVILSHFINDAEGISQMAESESYQKALAGVRYFLNNIRRMDDALVWMQSEVFNEKDKLKEILVIFIDILKGILQDAASGTRSEIDWYDKEIEKLLAMKVDLSAWLLILLTSKDKCSRPFNAGLMLDQMILEMKEVIE